MKILKRERTRDKRAYCLTCDEIDYTGALALPIAEQHALSTPGHDVVYESHETTKLHNPVEVDA